MCRRHDLKAKILARCVEDEDGCLIWQGPDSGKGRGGGYPRMNVDGAMMAVHIVLWVIENGPIPPRKQLDHTCRKRRCVLHTEMVTHRVNMLRRDEANGVARTTRKRKRVRRNKAKDTRGRATGPAHSRAGQDSGSHQHV